MKSRIRRIGRRNNTGSTRSRAAFMLTLAILLTAGGMGMTAMAAAPAGASVKAHHQQIRGIRYRDNIRWENIIAEEYEKEGSRVSAVQAGEQPEEVREMPGKAEVQPPENEDTVWGKPVSGAPLVTWESISAEIRQEQQRTAALKTSAAGSGQVRLPERDAAVLGAQRSLPGAARTGDEAKLLLSGILLILSIAAMGGISISWKRGSK